MCADLTPKPFFWALRVLFSPVWFPGRITWKDGDNKLVFEVHNQYNSTDLKNCRLRTQFAGGRMATARSFRDIPISCPPGKRRQIRIPVWDAGILDSLNGGAPALCRCSLLDPKGFRVLTHDILIVPEKITGKTDKTLKIGPDAK